MEATVNIPKDVLKRSSSDDSIDDSINEYTACSDWDKEQLYIRVRELLDEVAELRANVQKYEEADCHRNGCYKDMHCCVKYTLKI